MMNANTNIMGGLMALACCVSTATLSYAQLPSAPNEADAIAQLEAKAQSMMQQAEALYAMGMRYRTGMPEKQNPEAAFECFRKAAELGHAEAQYMLGECYQLGEGVEEDPELGENWTKRAAVNGSIDAMSSIGMQVEGESEWLLRAAQKGSTYSMFQWTRRSEEDLDMWLLLGAEEGMFRTYGELEVSENMGKAMLKRIERMDRVFKEGAKLPLADEPMLPKLNIEARPTSRASMPAQTLYRKAQLCKAGVVVKQDLKEAYECFRKAAELGHADAQFELSICYLLGLGVEKNRAQYHQWLKKAVESGSAEAECIKGMMTEDETEAVKWLLSAALKGNAYAGYCIGMRYMEGRGVPYDANAGTQWLLRAAAQGIDSAVSELKPTLDNTTYHTQIVSQLRKSAGEGNDRAMFSLGECYAAGAGVPQSYAEALKCYHAIVDADDGLSPQAHTAIAECYAKGWGVPQDPAKALEWYLKAAEEGDISALCTAFHCYMDGVGTPRNKEKAFALLREGSDLQSSPWRRPDPEFERLVEKYSDEMQAMKEEEDGDVED